MRAKIAVLAGCIVATAPACGGSAESVGDGDAATSADGASSTSDGGAGADGGSSDGGDGGGADAGHGAGVGCTQDSDCNGDLSVSSDWGFCYQGVCMCHEGFWVQTNGKCNTTPPPGCTQQGGTCRQATSACQPGELESSASTKMSCGDLIEAVCCFGEAQCTGPDFRCCGPNGGTPGPICENGWRTCPSDATPLPVDRPCR